MTPLCKDFSVSNTILQAVFMGLIQGILFDVLIQANIEDVSYKLSKKKVG